MIEQQPTEQRRITLNLDLELSREVAEPTELRVSGVVHGPAGDPTHFVGWTGLLGVIEQLAVAAPTVQWSGPGA